MNHHFWGKSIGGLILIGIGFLFLLSVTGIVNVDIGYLISNFWPVFLILIGLSGLLAQRRLDHGRSGAVIWSLFMIVLGLIFLNRNFGWLPQIDIGDLFKLIFPVILIVVGIKLLLRPKRQDPYTPKDWRPYNDPADFGTGTADVGEGAPAYNQTGEPHGPSSSSYDQMPPPPPYAGTREAKRQYRRQWREYKREWKHGWKHGHHGCGGHSWNGHQGYDRDDVINRHNFIGDVYIGRDYWELKPTYVSHFIGDTDIDLTRANIPFGETVIQVSAFIGDLRVYVPNDVQLEVSVRASSFLGNMNVFERREEGMLRHMVAESPHYYEAEKRIRIIVNLFIGDVRVKRVG